MKRPLATFCLIVVILVFLSQLLHPPKIREYAEADGMMVTLTGQVIHKEIKYNYLCITLSEIQLSDSDIHFQENKLTNKYNQDGNFKNPKGVVCYFDLEKIAGNEPKMGMYLCVEGEVKEYDVARNPGQFNMDAYYLSKNIDFKLYQPHILARSVEYSKLKEGLWKIEQRSASIFDQVLTKTESAMMKSIMLGDKSELDQDIRDLFQASGIAHILAISGLHIAFLGGLFYKVLQRLRLPIGIRALISITMIILYGMLTGMPISAFRACVMFSLRIIADVTKRTYDAITAVAIAAVFVVLKEPGALFTAGMQLSFAAVLGVACFPPLFGGKTGKWLHGPISIFIVTFPIICYHYFEYSLYAVLLNMFVIPLMSVVMILGVLVLTLGTFSVSMAIIPGKMLICILIFYEKISDITVKIPGSRWVVGRPRFWQICLYYGCLLLFFWGGRKLSSQLRIIWLCVAIFMVSKHFDPVTTLTMLDVGQGDGIVIIDTSGGCITVDGGSSSEKNIGKNIITPFLKYHGVNTIEYAVLTHLDEDHYSGIVEILQDENSEICIKNIVFSEAVKQCEETREIYEKILFMAAERNISVAYMKEKDVLVLKDLKLKCLWPVSDQAYQDSNAGSIVLEITSEHFKGLLTGDISAREEEMLCQRLSYENYDWLKAAHHGSKYSNSESFLEEVSPDSIWISCGEDNRYGHPHEEALERMEKVTNDIYITTKGGAKMLPIP